MKQQVASRIQPTRGSRSNSVTCPKRWRTVSNAALLALAGLALPLQAETPGGGSTCDLRDTDADGIPDQVEKTALYQYRPWLYFDAGERVWPCSATWFAERSRLINGPDPIDYPDLVGNAGTILSTGAKWTPETPTSSYKLNLEDAFRRGEYPNNPEQSAEVPIYGHVVPLFDYPETACLSYKGFDGAFGTGWLALQYWILFPYNDATKFDNLLEDNPGDHEGDWVWIDVLIDAASGLPQFVVYHHHGDDPSIVPWEKVEKREGAPIAYVEQRVHELWPEVGGWGGLTSPVHRHMGDGLKYQAATVLNLGEARAPAQQETADAQTDAELALLFNGEWGDFTGEGLNLGVYEIEITNPKGPVNQQFPRPEGQISVVNLGTGDFVVNGTDGDDSIRITSGAGVIQVEMNGSVTQSPAAGISRIFSSGGEGGDTIEIGLLPETVSGGVCVNGGGGDDTINAIPPLHSVIYVDGGEHGAGGDTLNVFGENLDYLIADSALTATTRQPIHYSNVETLGVANGTYQLPGRIAVNVDVNQSAVLYGNGTVQGALAAHSTGVVSPGLGIGRLSSASVAFASTATYQVELLGLGYAEHDLLHAGGMVNLGGAYLNAIAGTRFIPGDEIMIIHNQGSPSIVGKFAQGDMIFVGDQAFAIDYAYDGDGDGIFNDVALVRYGAEQATDPCNPARQALFVSGTTGDDLIRLLPDKGNRSVHVIINSDDFGSFRPDGLLIAFGQAGNDTIMNETPSRPSWLYGQGGDDVLVAGNNASVLVGGIGNDHLVAGNASDILIGGVGADSLEGGNGNDLLVPGFTAFDTNTLAHRTALCAIYAEWTQGSGGWKGHIAHLTRGGGLNGTLILGPQTVFDDGGEDQVDAGNGQDWVVGFSEN